VDPLTVPEPEDKGPTEEDKRIEEARSKMPDADGLLLVDDFEEWASKVLSGTAWAYYRSAGESATTMLAPLYTDPVLQPTESKVSDPAFVYNQDSVLTPLAFDENLNAFHRYSFRPRILRNVTDGSLETTFMGVKSSLPIFISPAAMAKLGHPLGEVNLTKGAGECGIVQGVSFAGAITLLHTDVAHR
jgi:L-lactate dehydrogenase (cytochrome)